MITAVIKSEDGIDIGIVAGEDLEELARVVGREVRDHVAMGFGTLVVVVQES